MDRIDVQRARFRRLRAASNADLPALTVARAGAFLADFPDYGPAWLALGVALTEMTRHDEALEALESALRFCPPEMLRVPLSQFGHHYHFRGDYEHAAAWYQRAIDADPDHASGYIFLGAVLALQGRLGEAEGAHRAATDCPRGCIDEAYLNLGLVLRAQERLVEAGECFARAIELDPDYKAAKRALRDVRAAIAFARKKGDAGLL